MGLSDSLSLLYRRIATGLLLLMVFVFAGCGHSGHRKSADLSDNVRSFWGDSSVALLVNQPQNGYQVSFISNKDLIIAHFEIPKSDVFFMDVNFDDHEEFMQSYLGNGWIGYYCYDLINGWSDASPGLIGAMQEEPYCSFSSGINAGYDNYVAFDYEKKEIFVLTTSGCCAHTDTWAKYFEGDSLVNRPCVKVFKQEHHSFDNGIKTIETYALQNDTFKMVGGKETGILEFKI